MDTYTTGAGETAFVNFRVVATTDTRGYDPSNDSSLVVFDGKIKWLGPSDHLVISVESAVIEGHGRLLTPGLIDCHTHLIYGGDRSVDFQRRLSGASYTEIAQQGGGIHSTVEATRLASEDELYDLAKPRIDALVRGGVTTVEIKSGYGLELESELKMLSVAGSLNRDLPIEIVRTQLAAHTAAQEYRGRRADYVTYCNREILPATSGSCEAVDVFCESIGFSLAESESVLQAARDLGLLVKIHAEQLSNLGGAAMAAQLGALSADHLEYLDEQGVRALAEAGTVATLLPGAFYFLGQSQKPPIALLRDYAVPMALATDHNPGSSPLASLLLAMNMGCTLFGLTPKEGWAGVTINAAKALGREAEIGSIETGKLADFAVWNISSPAELAYGIGHNPCHQVYKRGVLIHESPF